MGLNIESSIARNIGQQTKNRLHTGAILASTLYAAASVLFPSMARAQNNVNVSAHVDCEPDARTHGLTEVAVFRIDSVNTPVPILLQINGIPNKKSWYAYFIDPSDTRIYYTSSEQGDHLTALDSVDNIRLAIYSPRDHTLNIFQAHLSNDGTITTDQHLGDQPFGVPTCDDEHFAGFID